MISILCSGTRGDVQPYIALAQQLGKLGLSARIAAGKDFESFVRGYGVDFHSIDVDYASAGVDEGTVRQAQSADNLLKMFGSFRKLRDFGVHMVEKYRDACLGSDAIVYHPGLTIGYFMAERMGVPAILASPFPLHRTSARLSVVNYGKGISTALTNRLSYGMLQSMLWMASESSLKPFLRAEYDSLPEGFGMPFERHTDGRHPAIVSCSGHIFERPADWNPHVHQHGYWVVEEPREFKPAPELEAFLEAGEAPVYIGFGSMANPADAGRVGGIAVEALRLAGKRGLLGGMPGLASLPESVMSIGNVPHTWLFPRMAAVVHHGGAGTSAAGFLAGVPSAITPFALDQFAWAWRSHELGIGAKPVPFKKLTPRNLADAILSATEPDRRERAAELGKKIAAETGARDSALVIARAMGLRA